MLLPILLSLLSFTTEARTKDLFCETSFCAIPYDAEGNQNGTEVCYADEARTIKVKEVNWKTGRREGPAKCWEGGKLSQEAQYRNDTLNGLFIEYKYDSNGHLVNLMEDNEITGLQFSVDDSGRVTRIHYCLVGDTAEPAAIFSCRDRDYGRYERALAEYRKAESEKDKLAREKEAKRMNGPQEARFSSGGVRSSWNNVNGRIHGKYLAYREDGKLRLDCEYKKGFRDGLCLEYDEAGRLDSRSTYEKDTLVKSEHYFDNGKTSLTVIKEGHGFCTTEYYDTGMKYHSYCLLGDGRRWSAPLDGPYLFWFENGQLSQRAQYEKNIPTGLWESFDLNGNLFQEAHFEKGVLTKTIYYYRKAPQHRIVRELFTDGSVKKETRLEGLEGDKPQIL